MTSIDKEIRIREEWRQYCIFLRNAGIAYKSIRCYNPDAKVNLYCLEYLKYESHCYL
jgi:hypothetical protein